MTRLPTIFLSHGSPMHALEPGGAGRAWRAIASDLPRPRAVLVASAHWETSLPMLTGRERHDTIHDFSGFRRRSTTCATTRRARRISPSTPRRYCAPRAARRP